MDGALYGDTAGRDRLTLERFRMAVFRRLLWLYHKIGNGRITDVNRLVPRHALAEKNSFLSSTSPRGCRYRW